jgi:hypothetical protein
MMHVQSSSFPRGSSRAWLYKIAPFYHSDNWLRFGFWIALTFINPLVAMGPTFYILYHNLYNSWPLAGLPLRTPAE